MNGLSILQNEREINFYLAKVLEFINKFASVDCHPKMGANEREDKFGNEEVRENEMDKKVGNQMGGTRGDGENMMERENKENSKAKKKEDEEEEENRKQEIYFDFVKYLHFLSNYPLFIQLLNQSIINGVFDLLLLMTDSQIYPLHLVS